MEAVLLGFNLRQNVIQVVKRLDGGRKCRWADPARGGGDDAHARRIELFRVQLDGIRNADDRRLGAILRGKAQVADTARDHEADVTVRQVIAAAGFADDVRDLLARPWHLEADGLGRHLEALEMLFESEDAALIKADALKDAVAVKETVVKDRDLGVSLRIEFSVDVDVHECEKANLGGLPQVFPAESPPIPKLPDIRPP